MLTPETRIAERSLETKQTCGGTVEPLDIKSLEVSHYISYLLDFKWIFLLL